MRVEALPAYVWRVAVSGDLVHHPDVMYASALDAFEVSAASPFHRHVDGEPLPLSDHVRFSVVPNVLGVRT
jgi:diacylglycerol kinase family enzyme